MWTNCIYTYNLVAKCRHSTHNNTMTHTNTRSPCVGTPRWRPRQPLFLGVSEPAGNYLYSSAQTQTDEWIGEISTSLWRRGKICKSHLDNESSLNPRTDELPSSTRSAAGFSPMWKKKPSLLKILKEKSAFSSNGMLVHEPRHERWKRIVMELNDEALMFVQVHRGKTALFGSLFYRPEAFSIWTLVTIETWWCRWLDR